MIHKPQGPLVFGAFPATGLMVPQTLAQFAGRPGIAQAIAPQKHINARRLREFWQSKGQSRNIVILTLSCPIFMQKGQSSNNEITI